MQYIYIYIHIDIDIYNYVHMPQKLYNREHNKQLLDVRVFSMYWESDQMIIPPILAQQEKICIHFGAGHTNPKSTRPNRFLRIILIA